jgi:hypothetical protein
MILILTTTAESFQDVVKRVQSEQQGQSCVSVLCLCSEF